MIVATHDPEVVAAADRRVELEEGRLAHDGPPISDAAKGLFETR